MSISHQKGDGIGAERIKFINSLSQSVVEKEPQGKRAAFIWVSALLPLRAQEGRRAGLWGERIASRPIYPPTHRRRHAHNTCLDYFAVVAV